MEYLQGRALTNMIGNLNVQSANADPRTRRRHYSDVPVNSVSDPVADMFKLSFGGVFRRRRRYSNGSMGKALRSFIRGRTGRS
ncbi:hypothetical protein ACFX2I_025105 [Malus domestica]